MTKMNKTDVVAEIKERINASEAVLLVNYRGLSVKEIGELRRSLTELDGHMTIYKNTLTEIALRELALPSMDEQLEGPTAFVFVKGDPVAPAKALTTFAKKNKALELKGALLGSVVIDQAGLVALSKLPSREELIAKLLGTIQNPMRGIATVCAGPARGLVTALGQLAKEKEAA